MQCEFRTQRLGTINAANAAAPLCGSSYKTSAFCLLLLRGRNPCTDPTLDGPQTFLPNHTSLATAETHVHQSRTGFISCLVLLFLSPRISTWTLVASLLFCYLLV